MRAHETSLSAPRGRSGLDGVDEVFKSFFDTGVTPGLSYGVVEEGRLVHAAGLGRTGVTDQPPGADSVFRIASMTKSFTAAAVLILRDDGRLLLDSPVDEYVPELAGLALPTRDSARLTVRHLLSMSAGLPTDDAWGDRQESLSDERFGEFLRGGFGFDSPPGTRFEYSNLGFAILGRVVGNVSGESYRDYVTSQLLRPLGLEHSVFDSDSAAPDLLVHGHRRVDDDWVQEEFDSPGAFSSIGGLYSSVADVARWIGGFTGAFPARDDPSDPHPLSRATRREMQQQHSAMSPSARLSTSGLVRASAPGYGFGLFVDSNLRWGQIVSHPGGYPGFGSCMCWHPTSGLGVVGLANATYAKVSETCREALEVLLGERAAPALRISPWPESARLRRDVAALVSSWDDTLADRIFAVNMDLDVPRHRRRADIARAVHSIGGLAPGRSSGDLEAQSPSQLTWWLEGGSGRLRVHLGLSPERPPRVQTLTVDAVPNPADELAEAARSLTEAFNADPPRWPVAQKLEGGLDVAPMLRLAAAARILDGPLELLPDPVAGDGRRTATFRLSSGSALWHLVITLAENGGGITACDLTAVDINEKQNVDLLDC
jgi:CubicO group peptidase (beta-lactamase class C family)